MLNKIKNNVVLKNILTLLTGNVIAQVILYSSIPFFTRYYGKEAFGILAMYVAVSTLLKTIGTFNFELSILIPEKKEDSFHLFAFGFIVNFLMSLIVFIILFFFNDLIFEFLGLNKLKFVYSLIPLSVFFIGNINLLEYYLNRKKRFNQIANSNVIKSISVVSGQTGFLSLNNIGLVYGLLLGQFIQTLYMVKSMYAFLKEDLSSFSVKRMLRLVVIHKDIPIYNTLTSFTNTLSNELPIFFLGKFYNIQVVALYSLSIRLVKAPAAIFTSPISKVFFNQLSELDRESKDVLPLFYQFLKKLFVISLFVFVGVFVISNFVDVLFGKDWLNTKPMIWILIPWLFVAFVASPISSITIVKNKQKKLFYIDVILLLSRIMALYLGYIFFQDELYSLFFYSIIGMFFSSYWISFFYKIAKNG